MPRGGGMKGEIDRVAAEPVPGAGRRLAGMRPGGEQRGGAPVVGARVRRRPAHPDALDRQPIDRQRPGLIGGDQRAGAEPLDGRQLAHDDVAQPHAVHRNRQRDGHRDRQAFRDRGDGERNREQENLGEAGAADRFEPGENDDQRRSSPPRDGA